MNLRKFLLLTLSIFHCLILFAQESESSLTQENLRHHQISLMTGYAWVPQTVSASGESEIFIIPTLGLDYNYWFSHKFSLGLINDIELSRYFVEDGDTYLERNNKYIVAIVALYEPIIGLGLFAGPGFEYDKHGSFPLIKTGIEYSKRFEEGWAVGIGASIDVNELYQTVSLGIIVSKML